MTEKRARRLATIAKWINEHCVDLEAEVKPSSFNTDRTFRNKGSGRNIRLPGKGRKGNRLTVRDLRIEKSSGWMGDPSLLLNHNSAETYRRNDEVEDWLERWCRDNPDRVSA